MSVIDTYVHFGTSCVPLRAFVCEILPNTIDTQPPRCLHDRYRNFIDCSTPVSRLRRSAFVWTRDRMHGMIQPEAMPFIFFCVIVFWNKNRLLPIFTCIFGLSATYFDIFARRALVRSRTPMILCLSNARSGDLHFGVSFVALRALVREIIPNTIHTHVPHTYIHTYMT